MPQILSKKKIKLIQTTATEEEKELLKWRKSCIIKNSFIKEKEKSVYDKSMKQIENQA